MSSGMTGIPWQSGASRLKDTIRKTKFRKQKQTDENLSLQHLANAKGAVERRLWKKVRLKPYNRQLILKQPWWQYPYR
jgi:hypothetical protein